LDIEKAFDRIDRQKLWERLRKMEVNDHLAEAIRGMYRDNKIKLNLEGAETQWIENNVGVRQGCSMSPILFNFFVEELFNQLRQSEMGIHLWKRIINSLGFADDIAIFSNSGQELQNLLNIVNEYGREWGIKFSGTKCKVMIFGEAENEGWLLGNEILEVVNQYKYLGMWVSNGQDIFMKHKKEKELGMIRMLGMLRSISGKVVNKYNIIRELW
jgi:hypothetical protein